MKKAFSYMFSDNKFYPKAFLFLVYVIFLVYCSVFSFSSGNGQVVIPFLNYIYVTLFMFLGYSIFEGYKINTIKSLSTENENLSVLPILNLKKDLIIGFKFLISFLIFSIPFLCIIGALGFITGFASMFKIANLLIGSSGILLILSILLYVIYLTCFLPASILVFAKTNSVWSFYKFEEMFKIASTNKKEYAKSAFMYLILGILTEECYRACLIFNNKPLILFLFVLFISACVVTYMFFIMCYFVAKINKDI